MEAEKMGTAIYQILLLVSSYSHLTLHSNSHNFQSPKCFTLCVLCLQTCKTHLESALELPGSGSSPLLTPAASWSQYHLRVKRSKLRPAATPFFTRRSSWSLKSTWLGEVFKNTKIQQVLPITSSQIVYTRTQIQLLESPIPAAAPASAAPSQKAPSDDISGTKRGTKDPLVSKRLEKNPNKKKLVKNGQNGQKGLK